MENTTHNLFEESLPAKINRLEQTIQELKNLNSMLMKGIKIDDRRTKEMIQIRDKKIERQENEIIELNTELTLLKELINNN